MLDNLIHAALLLILPPLLLGIINKTKAKFAGRTGAPVLQPYHDLIKLARKAMVISGTTTWVFRAGPVATLAAVATAGFLVPLGGSGSPIAFTGDLILFAYLFALGRFFTTTAALDTGSSFEGMGASREVTFGWWPGDAIHRQPVVYAYASPAPDRLEHAVLTPSTTLGRWPRGVRARLDLRVRPPHHRSGRA